MSRAQLRSRAGAGVAARAPRAARVGSSTLERWGRMAALPASVHAPAPNRARGQERRAVELSSHLPASVRYLSARKCTVRECSCKKKPPPAPLNVTRWLLQCNFKKSHSKCAAAFCLQLFKGVPVQWSSRRACFQRSRRSSSLVFEQVQPRVTVLRRSTGGSTVDRSVVRGLQPPHKAVPVKKPSNDSCAGGIVISFACLHAKRGKDMFFRSPAAAPRRRT